MSRLSTLVLVLGITGCAELFSAHPRVVARIDGQELTVDRLAELLVLGQPLPLTEEVGAELATHWIDVAALAQRMVEGDSLWDSTFVREAMWLNLQQLTITRFRNQLASGNVTVNPATVDSAFRVGEHRVVAHVLKAVPAGSSPDYRREQRTAAENVFEQLRRGGSWEAANAVSDDSVARVNNGNLGVLRRGVALPRFENAAYALDPGAISPVVETEYGYHVIFRPMLEDVRPQFTGFVQQELRARFDGAYNTELVSEYNVRVDDQAPTKLRAIAGAPFRAYNTGDQVVTYEGGHVTSARFADYLRLLAPETQREMTVGNARELAEFAVGITIQEIVARKADSAGMQISDSVFAQIVDNYRSELAELWNQLGVTPGAVHATEGTPEINAVRLVDSYMDAVVSRQATLTAIPPFLVTKLLEEAEWEVDPRALTVSVQLAQRLQAAASDSAAAVVP